MSESFIDEVTFDAISGDGGDGCVSFRRQKFVERGGPDGGDGGRGGDVILIADRNRNTLGEFRGRRVIRAENGHSGGGSGRSGASGASVEIRVPVGTMVFDRAAPADAEPLADLSHHDQPWVAGRGGRGGQGNSHFATATRQAPDFAGRGQAGEIRRLRLSLKLLADVGLVGLPNAGKSTLLRRISAARPRVGAYPFTTLVPSLGVVEQDQRRFVVADIPGLIEGASRGVGLGDRFLRHIERTRVLVHLLDAGTAVLEGRKLAREYQTIRSELGRYRPELLERPEIVVFNKIDLLQDRSELDEFRSLVEATSAQIRISAATGEGIESLVRAIAQALDLADSQAEAGDVS